MLSSKLPRLQNLLLSSSVAVYLEVGGWRIFLSMRALNYCGGSVEKKWDLFFTIYSVIPFPCNFLPFLLYSSREAQNAAGAFFFLRDSRALKNHKETHIVFPMVEFHSYSLLVGTVILLMSFSHSAMVANEIYFHFWAFFLVCFWFQ